MPYDHDYVCMMKEPVVCELCNKSYAIGRMISSTLIDAHTLPGQTEGLRVGCGGMGGFKEWSDGRV